MLNATLGYYGHLNYGSEMVTRLYAPFLQTKEQLREEPVAPLNNGCAEFKVTDFVPEGGGEKLEILHERGAVMVRRGGCSFVTKTLNAQKIGARLAIIMDNVEENEDNIIMIDSKNQGDLVRIPTYMISNHEGEALYKALLDGQHVVLKYSLEMVTIDASTSGQAAIVPY